MAHEQVNPAVLLAQHFRHHKSLTDFDGSLSSPLIEYGFCPTDHIRFNEVLACWIPICHFIPYLNATLATA